MNGYRVEIKTFEGNIIRETDKPTLPTKTDFVPNSDGYKVEETNDNKIPWYKRWFQK